MLYFLLVFGYLVALLLLVALLVLPLVQSEPERPLEDLLHYLQGARPFALYSRPVPVWTVQLCEGKLEAHSLSTHMPEKAFQELEQAIQTFRSELEHLSVLPVVEEYLAWNFWKCLLLFHPCEYGQAKQALLAESLDSQGWQWVEVPEGTHRQDLQKELAESRVVLLGSGEVVRVNLLVGLKGPSETFLSLPFRHHSQACPVLFVD